jgi:hypothetical protein
MLLERDPASVMWDRAATALLARARGARGDWVATRIAQPTDWQRARLALRGIFPDGPDNTSAQGGRSASSNARSRWGRAFVRAVYYNRLGGEAVKVEVGRMLPARGVIPRGRAVRVKIFPGGGGRAAARLAEDEQVFTDDQPGERWSDLSKRDW